MSVIYNITNALEKLNIKYKINEPLAQYTSFKIGGECKLMVIPKSEDEIIYTLKLINENNLKKLILGNGSNVLISDDGFDGVIVLLGNDFSDIKLIDEDTVFASAGASLSRLCTFAMQNSLSGLEFAYGIPGTVGGAVYMNAGAYGGEIKDVLKSAYHITDKLNSENKSAEDLDLSYRHSFYSDKDYVITGAVFKLKKGNRDEIKAIMTETMNKRKSKQPLEYPSAGSTFKRPEGAFAAKLIDDCGLKGKTVGGAVVSEKHSGFVINKGNATCKDVLELIDIIKNEVKTKTGFTLECEVKYIK